MIKIEQKIQSTSFSIDLNIYVIFEMQSRSFCTEKMRRIPQNFTDSSSKC